MAIVSDIFNTSGSLEEVVSVILTDAIQLALIIEAIIAHLGILVAFTLRKKS